MKCIHEWRIFGTRMEEETFPTFPNRGPVVCTKCGVRQTAIYEVIERRRVVEPFNDVIVKIKSFEIHTSTILGYNELTDKLFDDAIYNWNDKEEQWIKVYPVTILDYLKVIKDNIV